MKHDWLPAATVIIGSFSSHCNNCGKECLPSELTHDSEAGYGGRGEGFGCGITFTHSYGVYVGEDAQKAVANLRPDLEFIPIDLSWYF